MLLFIFSFFIIFERVLYNISPKVLSCMVKTSKKTPYENFNVKNMGIKNICSEKYNYENKNLMVEKKHKLKKNPTYLYNLYI